MVKKKVAKKKKIPADKAVDKQKDSETESSSTSPDLSQSPKRRKIMPVRKAAHDDIFKKCFLKGKTREEVFLEQSEVARGAVSELVDKRRADAIEHMLTEFGNYVYSIKNLSESNYCAVKFSETFQELEKFIGEVEYESLMTSIAEELQGIFRANGMTEVEAYMSREEDGDSVQVENLFKFFYEYSNSGPSKPKSRTNRERKVSKERTSSKDRSKLQVETSNPIPRKLQFESTKPAPSKPRVEFHNIPQSKPPSNPRANPMQKQYENKVEKAVIGEDVSDLKKAVVWGKARDCDVFTAELLLAELEDFGCEEYIGQADQVRLYNLLLKKGGDK